MQGTLAIDLGSSTTVVAWQDASSPGRLLELPPYSCGKPSVVPSLLWLRAPDHERPLIGAQVIDAELADDSGPGLHRDFKRLIGTSSASQAGIGHPREVRPGWLSPENAGALLLQRIWQALPADLNPSRLVLTAPIETYRGYRQWLQSVSAGLDVPEVALVDEPTAAAIGSGLPPGSRVLVLDLGGGTIDLSLVALVGGEGRAAPIAQLLRFSGRDLDRSRQALRCARVIGKAGLPIGGRDIDRWIAARFHSGNPAPRALLRLAEKLKCQLSEREEGAQIWSVPGQKPRQLRLERQELERILVEQGLLDQLDGLLEAVLAAGRREGMELRDVDAVLMVGGSSRIPLLRRWIEERAGEVPLRGERPVEAVAMGALALTPGVRVRDVLARGVSLQCWDQRSGEHRWHPLFVAGQAWPTEQPLELVLACSRDGQTDMELVLGEPLPEERAEVVFEGGLPVLRERPAGSPRVVPWDPVPPPLPLATPGRRGADRLRLRFWIDAEGQLLLQVMDLEHGSDPAESAPLKLGPVQ